MQATQKVYQEQEVDEIIAYINPDNLASVRAFAKAGFVKKGIVQIGNNQALEMRFKKGTNYE
jgi:RimJ/RimL family protein N-acetyltransferase